MNARAEAPVLKTRAQTRFRADQQPGAVVVGGDYQGLSIVRSLGQRGISVCVIDDETSISSFSKYTSKSIKLKGLRDGDATVEGVEAVGRQLGLEGWVLFPTRDEHVAAFSRHRDRLARFFRVPTPPWDCVQWAWDKRNTYRRASELSIPIPRTFYLRCLEDLKHIDFPPPYAIKPAIKEHFIYSTHAKAWRANSPEELRSLCEKAAAIVDIGEVMIQEVIPGSGENQVSYCAFVRDGRPIGKMVACRQRQHPLEFGRASTFVKTIELPILEQYSETFLSSIDYYGLVEVEYKCDPRDGTYKLLDVNARTWGYHGLGLRAGVDFSYMLYADQVGRPVEPCCGRPGMAWVRLLTDLPTAVVGYLQGEIKIASYVRSLLGCNTEAVFSIRDPFPGLAEMFLIPYLMLKRGF